MGIFEKFKLGFKKSASTFTSGLKEIIIKKEIDDRTLNEIEDFLIQSDVGVAAAEEIRNIISGKKIDPNKNKVDEINSILKNYIIDLMSPLENNNNKVIFSASDTFRAAAIEQLENWAKKIDVEIIKSSQGSDPASVAYKAVDEALKNQFTHVLIDTAGRLQNKKNLMEEYKKIANVTKKIDPNAPHEVLLVLDATSGQNVINQVEEFNKIIPITGLIMTKLDGTAKGGILIAIAKKYKLPIIALGLGEKEDDLQIFKAEQFAEAFITTN